jgi:hypothetical protein
VMAVVGKSLHVYQRHMYMYYRAMCTLMHALWENNLRMTGPLENQLADYSDQQTLSLPTPYITACLLKYIKLINWLLWKVSRSKIFPTG